MKKIIATTLATAGMIASATPFVSAADNFSGAYAGLTAGFSSLKGQGLLSTTATSKNNGTLTNALTDSNSIVGLDAGASNTGTFGQTGFNGGLLLGYGVLMDSFYVGGEVSAIFNSNSDGTPWTLANYGSTVAGLTTAGATLSTAGATLSSAPQAQYAVETKSVDFKQKESFGLALRFGYLATQKAMLYLSLGLNYSRFSITENLSAGGNDYIFTGASLLNVLSALPSSTVTTTVETTAPLGTTSSARSLSFTPGVGTEIMLSNNLAFRTDFTYEMGKTLFGSYDTTNLPNGIKATRSSFRVGLSYHF